MTKCILATGGAGYIGSHVVTELLGAGYRVVILDNFENSDPIVVRRIKRITGRNVSLVTGDVRDRGMVERVLRMYNVDAVIHLAGKKAVGESVANPMLYFDDNLNGAISLLTAMKGAGVFRLVFSSSATVYGIPKTLPVTECAKVSVTNPYGRTKLVIEEMIDDLIASDPAFSAISLRYFNPVGAHETALIGENPRGIPNNLFPFVAQTAAGERDHVQVFGGDYDTPDGTGMRDYIHVVDLAKGHVAAVQRMMSANETGQHRRINLGTGTGYTVLQVIEAFSKACGFPIPYAIVPRRAGDAAASVADPSYAKQYLGWSARFGLDRMCQDQWAFNSRVLAAKKMQPSRTRPNGKMADFSPLPQPPLVAPDRLHH